MVGLLAAIGAASSMGAVQRSRVDNATPPVAVGPQYDTTHVYVTPDDMKRFAESFLATFGGQNSKQIVTTVTPTPSSTIWQALQTPVGTISLFGFKTPIPYPFGTERTGYLVTDMDLAIAAARATGADILVAPFSDPIGRDAIIQWPGGVNMQLYWHSTATSYPAFQTIPENRVYVSPARIGAFMKGLLAFSHGQVISDNPHAPCVDIGIPAGTCRRIRTQSAFGKLTAFVTNGHLPFPYGRETTGYEVADLSDTLSKAKAGGVTVLIEPFRDDDRQSAMVAFPGGYIAEIHARAP
jgi:predicted enzyme related to lactoylglutathione lyase